MDESIQAQAEQVLKQAKKVSTGCGGTPPRELKSSEDPARKAREMGTSPPPQNISTQVNEYQILFLVKFILVMFGFSTDLRCGTFSNTIRGDACDTGTI